MTKPKTDYEMKRDALANSLCAPMLRSMVSRGFALEQAVKMSDFGAAYERDRAEKLVKALEKIASGLTTQQEKVEFYTKKEACEALAEYKGKGE